MALRRYVVAKNERRGPYATLTISGKFEASAPGQFYMLRGDWGADPLLARPLSILGEDSKSRTAAFLLKVVGEGTRRLYEMDAGEHVFGLGPLGRPFPTDFKAPGPIVLVGGGVGVVPLVYLAEKLRSTGIPLRFLQGARSAGDLLLLKKLEAVGVSPATTTEDGSHGERGLVTAPLEKLLAEEEPQAVCACGPAPMLKAVSRLCRGRAPLYVSLEARMGCGYGVCLGCVVAVERNNKRAYERVCKEGPVFDGEAVVWE